MKSTDEIDKDYACGFSFWRPAWLQKFATTKWFLAVYGLLGTIRAMSYMYFVVTLTTIEKRFHMPSQTTGIVLSGNEISQILLSLILSYAGGQRNRPLWIAWGIVCSGLSCFVLAAPHFIYGMGDDAFHLTKEYFDYLGSTSNLGLVNSTNFSSVISASKQKGLCNAGDDEEKCENIVTLIPLVLIFLSQFILGIGNTLNYSLGQSYLDDNTKKKNTPIMLAYSMMLPMIGPIFGFLLGFISLNMYIDPSKTPLISKDDPRWLGAWWFGWTILGTALVVFPISIGLFPKKLPKKQSMLYDAYKPKSLLAEETVKLNGDMKPLTDSEKFADDGPKLKDFPKALSRLLKNKLIMFNNISAVFYILGASGYITFMARYMEVQFHRSSQNATIVIGPLTMLSIAMGLLVSGWVLSKKKPNASKVLFWNVIIAMVYMAGQFSYMFFYCGDTRSMMKDGMFNLTSSCNQNCNCDKVVYSPVCHEATGKTFFSACHAGCNAWDQSQKFYSNCSCTLPQYNDPPTTNVIPFASVDTLTTPTTTSSSYFGEILTPGACLEGCSMAFYGFCAVSLIIHWMGSSGRIGNVLVNYRAVSPEDKSFALGLTLTMSSLFAMIPGPIIFGRVIDNTCLVWNYQCGKRGDCQLYDQEKYRYSVNGLAMSLTLIGAIFDFLVWYYGRKLDLYGQAEEAKLREMLEKDKFANSISPLLISSINSNNVQEKS